MIRASDYIKVSAGHVFAFGVLVVLPILIGGLVYLTWRTPDLLMFEWVHLLGLESSVEALRVVGAPIRPHVPEFVLFSVPDAAWAYAATGWMIYIWRDCPHPIRFLFIAFGPVCALGGEAGQLVGIVPGVFDPVDLILCAVAAIVAWAVVPLLPRGKPRPHCGHPNDRSAHAESTP